jgi:hypothetical protein
MHASYMPLERVRYLCGEGTLGASERALVGVFVSFMPTLRRKVAPSVATFKRASVRARAVVRSANVVGEALGVGCVEGAVGPGAKIVAWCGERMALYVTSICSLCSEN